jgi:hypothetical protein
MVLAKTMGNKQVDALAQQFVARIPEKPFGLSVDQDDRTLLIDDDHCVGGRLQQPPERLLGLFAVKNPKGRHGLDLRELLPRRGAKLPRSRPIPHAFSQSCETMVEVKCAMNTVTTETVEELLHRYEIAPPPESERFLRHAGLEAGVALALGGHKDAQGQKTITLTIGNLSQSRSCPLGEEEAQDIVERLQERHAIPHQSAEMNTLRNLLSKCSRMYATSEIESFIMKPVHLHEGGYRIDNVLMFSSRHLRIAHRLDAHAHDRGAVSSHRPTDTR